MRAVFNSNQFKKEMNNIVNYSVGFLEGVQKGKTVFLKTVGLETVELMKEFISYGYWNSLDKYQRNRKKKVFEKLIRKHLLNTLNLNIRELLVAEFNKFINN